MNVLTQIILAERRAARVTQQMAVALVRLGILSNKQGQHIYMMGEWTGYGS